MSTVLLPWVEALPWKQQSILFSGLRGPDGFHAVNTKRLSRWMRSVSQQNADPSKSYMSMGDLPTLFALAEELEQMPCHYVHHLADALAVIAYGHPDEITVEAAYAYHYHIAEEIFHFIPEPPEIFRWRHRDKPQGIDPEPVKPYDDRPWATALLAAEAI